MRNKASNAVHFLDVRGHVRGKLLAQIMTCIRSAKKLLVTHVRLAHVPNKFTVAGLMEDINIDNLINVPSYEENL